MNELDMTGYALRIRGLKKQYRLGEISGKTLQEEWHRWWALRRGEADPLSKIGEKQRIVGDRILALNGIDLDVREGEALGIIGKNGAGKSTLIKILGGATRPDTGEILPPREVEDAYIEFTATVQEWEQTYTVGYEIHQ